MNLLDHPSLVDQLAACYALGTLRGGARRRFETLARDHASVRARALLWQENFAALTELQRSDVPSPNVWKRIENQLPSARSVARAASPAAAASEALVTRLRRGVGLWRGVALASTVATVVAVAVGVNLQSQIGLRDQALVLAQATAAQATARLQAAPQVEYVAVLADDQAAASILVTFDAAKQTLTLKRVGNFQEGPDKSLQLWALPAGGGAQSLGVLNNAPVVKLTAAEGQVAVPTLAITLEKKGGVPAGSSAEGPILFKGALLKTTL